MRKRHEPRAAGPRRILVAIRDPSAVSVTVLQKVAALARASGVRVELFHAISEPVAMASVRSGKPARSRSDAAGRIAERAHSRLMRVASSRALARIRVSAHVEWDYPPHEAVIRRAISQRCDLVVGQAQRHALASRFFLSNTDWELIRHCPVPLLLIKSRGTYERAAVLAAIDPFHAHEKPAALDARILETARGVAQSLRGMLHLFHAYVPMAAVMPTAGAPPLAIEVSPELLRLEERRIRSAVDRLGDAAGIAPAGRHVQVGAASSELVACARATSARIVAMGAVSRSALKRLVIGSTAERVLDRLPCDVLIVKPQGFKTRVPKRAARRSPAR